MPSDATINDWFTYSISISGYLLSNEVWNVDMGIFLLSFLSVMVNYFNCVSSTFELVPRETSEMTSFFRNTTATSLDSISEVTWETYIWTSFLSMMLVQLPFNPLSWWAFSLESTLRVTLKSHFQWNWKVNPLKNLKHLFPHPFL